MEKVSQESLLKTLQSLNTGEHQINKAMDGFGTRKGNATSHKSNWIMELILIRLVETPSPNRLQNGADKFMEFTPNGYNEI